jgi:hypothetical protein
MANPAGVITDSQEAADPLPTTALDLPAGQLMQEAADVPADVLNLPAGQLVQVLAAAAEYVPARQLVQVLAAAAEYVPARQLMQLIEEEYLPAAHAVGTPVGPEVFLQTAAPTA